MDDDMIKPLALKLRNKHVQHEDGQCATMLNKTWLDDGYTCIQYKLVVYFLVTDRGASSSQYYSNMPRAGMTDEL